MDALDTAHLPPYLHRDFLPAHSPIICTFPRSSALAIHVVSTSTHLQLGALFSRIHVSSALASLLLSPLHPHYSRIDRFKSTTALPSSLNITASSLTHVHTTTYSTSFFFLHAFEHPFSGTADSHRPRQVDRQTHHYFILDLSKDEDLYCSRCHLSWPCRCIAAVSA